MEPDSGVPYTAYKPKRHSRTLSNNVSPRPSLSPPPTASPPPVDKVPLPTLTIQPDIVAPTPKQPISAPALENKPLPTPEASSSSKPLPATRRQSTFRRITPAAKSPLPSSPLRPSDSPLPSSPLRPPDANLPPARPLESRLRVDSLPVQPQVAQPVHQRTISLRPSAAPVAPPPLLTPPTRTSSLAPSPKPPPPSAVSPKRSPAPTTPEPLPPPTPPKSPSTPSSRTQRAVYRPGFQPKGVYRPRTDEFLETRKHKLDVGRIERTKLERRFEKLVELHFPVHGTGEKRPSMVARRSSSIFDLDFDTLKNVDPAGLWKGIMMQGQSEKSSIRAAEQRITPWQEDASVSKCPLCSASFHPITNRKHHCRLCGQIICSLPVRKSIRTAPCSLLFVVDPKTRRVEEVNEGVDYGVRRRRTMSMAGANAKAQQQDPEEEKFLKGIRICRECKPILQRQQYRQDFHQVPVFAKLYEAFVALEGEIEDALPQFQELLLTLANDDQPTKEASAARKRLLEAFSQYDALSKRIRTLPCTNGSSQDRVQQAIQTRASLFLQKNMIPLQSLPTPKRKQPSSSPTPEPPPIDTDSELAHKLQPLLEQEALLESFVEEANAHRKFEDAKTLKTNLAEIRAEIERTIASGEAAAQGKGKARINGR